MESLSPIYIELLAEDFTYSGGCCTRYLHLGCFGLKTPLEISPVVIEAGYGKALLSSLALGGGALQTQMATSPRELQKQHARDCSGNLQLIIPALLLNTWWS